MVQPYHVLRMNVDTAFNVNDTVKKPTGPKPRLPISSRRNSEDRRSDTMPKKNVSPMTGKDHSQEKSRKDSKDKSNPNSPLFSESGVRNYQSTPNSRLYPNLDEELYPQDESYTSTFTSHEFSYRNSSSSSNSSSLIASPRASVTVNKSRGSESSTRHVNQKTDYSGLCITIVMLLPIIIIAIVCTTYSNPEQQSNNKNEEMVKWHAVRKNIDDLQKLFPSQNKSIWTYFKSGILDVAFNRTKPAVILLLAIDDATTNCLVKEVARVVSQILGGTSYASLTPEILKNDINEVFTLVKDRTEETKTVVFTDILNMRPNAARALHDICDPYESLVEHAVYLIIMKSVFYNGTEEPTAFAEQKLKDSFSNKIEEGILEALITRVTAGAVLFIKEEKNVPCQK